MAAFTRGYLRIGRWRGAPLLLHWTLVLGALFFGGFRFAPAFWFGFFGLVLLHELGHAYFVRRFKQRLLSVEVHGLGGLCTWAGKVSPIRRAVIAWGGVVAQALVYLGAQLYIAVEGTPGTAAGAEVLFVATSTNLWIIAFNLIPIRPLDGAEAWPLFGLLWRRFQLRRVRELDEQARTARALSRASLQASDALEDLAADAPPPEIKSLVDDVLRRAKDEPGDPNA